MKSITDDNKNEYISYSYDDYKNVKLNSGETIDFVFTETYSTEVEDIEKRAQGFSVNFYMVLEPEKHNDDTKGDTTDEKISFNRNPATGDHIELYILLAVISLTFSVFVLKKTGMHKMKKTGLRLFILFTAVYAAFIPQLAKSLDGQSFKMVLENNIQLKDKLLVSYDVDGIVNTKIIPYDTKVSIDDPQKEGYTFKGWRTDEGEMFDLDTPIKDDINLTAVFDADVYSITYDLKGGHADNPNSYTIEDEVHITDPSRAGYTFDGWTGTDLTDLTKNLVIPRGNMGDRSYEAHWTVNQYTVVFDANGAGSGTMNPVTFTYDVSGYLPANTFEKGNDRFVGWNTDPDGSGQSYPDQSYVKNLAPGGEITLYAQWTPKENWAMFWGGRDLNKKMKQLAGNSGAVVETVDENIISIERFRGPSTSVPKDNNVAISSSPQPIYMWYDGTSGTIYYYSDAEYILLNQNSQNVFSYFKNLSNVDCTGFITDSVTNMSGMFAQNQSLTNLDLTSFNTAKVTNMASMFNQCIGATKIDVSRFDTRNVTDMNRMFTACEKITELDLSRFNTSKVKNMQKMFDYLPLVESIDVSNFDTSQVTDMWGMFRDCPKLKSLDISSFDTRNVTTMEEMFGCHWPPRTKTIFASVSSITVGPNFNTSKVTNMRRMFYLCKNLKSFNLRSAINQNVFLGFDTSSVTDMEGMFSDCTSLTKLDLSSFDTGNVTVMTKMFKNMANLTTIYVSDSFVVNTSNNNMFEDDVKLEGGAGTTYADAQVKGTSYARIDNPPSSPGYFTRKT
ncbi:MAG: BspA family leucine-rich repeat surface protein [Clostridia bacterium]|nr:BspA family leucine-rich repeat surface protein [Clostridia bacterium]